MQCNATYCIFRRNGYCITKPDIQPTNTVGDYGPMFECHTVQLNPEAETA